MSFYGYILFASKKEILIRSLSYININSINLNTTTLSIRTMYTFEKSLFKDVSALLNLLL